ncbi:MAG: SRPBCC family protein [Candidatus Hydrogenedentes bacterium]|nr:SRPBCC family protein [Candidatus Hydrogenedentota bacterium]
MRIPYAFDPALDLKLERVIDVPVELVWKAWTEPEHLKVWFCPKPWGVSDCEIDLRPGGIFRTTMLSPEGQEFPNMGCYLEVVPMERLVFTDALLPGYRPAEKSFMTGVVTMQPEGAGTRYIAMALHNSLEVKKQHEDMGFHDGWATALDQLVEHAKTLG